MGSQDRFGFEWNKYSDLDPNYELQFRRWVNPLGPDDFKDKKVLDAGCGMGRNSYWSLKWGAEKLVAFDSDDFSPVKNLFDLFHFLGLFFPVFQAGLENKIFGFF